ncbi:hypothetical protein ABBQ32_009240 [Trebouxia sp. C0010 RCD-2024]
MSVKSNTRVQLSGADRKKTCELAQANRDLKQEQLTQLAAEAIGKPGLKRTTVTGVLKEKTRWLKVSDTTASTKVKHRAPQFEKLEQALIQWFGQIRARNATKHHILFQHCMTSVSFAGCIGRSVKLVVL